MEQNEGLVENTDGLWPFFGGAESPSFGTRAGFGPGPNGPFAFGALQRGACYLEGGDGRVVSGGFGVGVAFG